MEENIFICSLQNEPKLLKMRAKYYKRENEKLRNTL
jgi:hypothetical protein